MILTNAFQSVKIFFGKIINKMNNKIMNQTWMYFIKLEMG